MMRNRAGYSLIELLVVMAVIAILAGALGVGVWKILQMMSIKAARAEMVKVLSALQEYRDRYGEYPARNSPGTDQTAALVDALNGEEFDCELSTGETGRYWTDPWSREFIYRVEGDRPVLRSCGPDRKPDTNDDIVVK